MRRLVIVSFVVVCLGAGGCHFREMVEWAKTKDASGNTPAGQALGSIPGAIMGNPSSWANLAEFVGVFVAGAIGGHVHGKTRERKKMAKKIEPKS